MVLQVHHRGASLECGPASFGTRDGEDRAEGRVGNGILEYLGTPHQRPHHHCLQFAPSPSNRPPKGEGERRGVQTTRWASAAVAFHASQ